MIGLFRALRGWLRRSRAPDPAQDVLGSASLPEKAALSVLPTTGMLRRLGWVRSEEWAGPLQQACLAHGIHTPARVAAFLAQVGHESGGGRWTREIWGPTPAQSRYEGRRDLGNTEPGDGRRFMGRGLIQITGRANTVQARDALRPKMDLHEFAAWLETREGAAQSAAWWWASRGLNKLADDDRFDEMTRRINGGFNGMADRRERWAAAKEAVAA